MPLPLRAIYSIGPLDRGRISFATGRRARRPPRHAGPSAVVVDGIEALVHYVVAFLLLVIAVIVRLPAHFIVVSRPGAE